MFLHDAPLDADVRPELSLDSGTSAPDSPLLDLPLGANSEKGDPHGEGSGVRYFDTFTEGSDIVAVVPAVATPACASHRQRTGWGPRVHRRRAPRSVFETSAPAHPKSHSTGRWLVALLILAALPLGAALGYYLNLAPPVAVLSPEVLDFGATVAGEIVEQQARLENRGEQTLRVLEMTLAGGEQVEFALLAEGCHGVSLAPGASCALRVAFRPTSPGPRRGDVVIRTNGVDGVRVLPLLGVGE